MSRLQVRCRDVHPGGCDVVMRGDDQYEVMADVQLHGLLAHDYGGDFYDEAMHRVISAKLAEQASRRPPA